MIVKDIISAIESKSTSIDELAEKHNVSDRTIQNKIKGLGFKWIAKEKRYDYLGSDIENTNAIEWDSLFNSSRKSIVKVNVNQNKSENKSENKGIMKSKYNQNESNYDSKETSNLKENQSTFDSIDRILAGESNAGRKYRGFYFDADVLSIIDKVNSGSKSDLVNEALRKVFKEKDLL